MASHCLLLVVTSWSSYRNTLYTIPLCIILCLVAAQCARVSIQFVRYIGRSDADYIVHESLELIELNTHFFYILVDTDSVAWWAVSNA